ncbi:hypothetical protein EBT31_20660, partial [bacterium]|nr:hypothetical protein [bacterium]
ANFLAYGNKLYVVRAANTTSTNTSVVVRNAVANTSTLSNWSNGEADVAAYVVKNGDDYTNRLSSIQGGDPDVAWIAKYPGELGNSLKISVCETANAYSHTMSLDNGGGNINSTSTATYATINVGSSVLTVNIAVGNGVIANAVTWATTLNQRTQTGDYIEVGNSTIGTQYMKVLSVSAVTNTSTVATFSVTFDDVYGLAANFTSTSYTRKWEYFNTVDGAPGTSAYQTAHGNTSVVDEVHVVVADEDGKVTGIPGTILEVFKNISRATDAKTEDGATNYMKNVINDTSNYVWWVRDSSTGASDVASALVASTANIPKTLSFQGGTDGLDENNASLATLLAGYDLFASAENVDVSLVLTGTSRGGTNGEQLANYLIDNIAETRKDCVVFVSPQKADVVNNAGSESTDVVT